MAVVTHNINLSPLQQSDAEALVMCLDDKTIAENTLIPYPYTITHANSWLQDNFAFEQQHTFSKNYAIRNQAGLLLGAIGAHFNYGYDSSKSEFGYWLGKPYRNKGIMTTAIKAFCDLAKSKLNLQVLEAHVFINNIASQKVLLKAGFAQIAVIPDYERDGVIHSAVRFEKVL